MKKFLRSIFSSCLGALLAFFVIGLVGIFIFSQIISSSSEVPDIEPNTVLRLSLNQEMPEKTNNVQLSGIELQNQDILGLRDLLRVLEAAKSDDRIEGIFFDADNVSLGLAGVSSLRQGILAFRESGKFVLAHSNSYSQGAYYLASAADSVFLNPKGFIDFRGFAAEIPYYKNMLDKFGVQVEVFYAGKFKSATEPYRRADMSDENRRQIRAYIEEIFDRFLADISKSRNITTPRLQEIVDNWEGRSAKRSFEIGLIDGVAYQDEVIDMMREKLGLDAKAKIKAIRPSKYFKTLGTKKKPKTKDKIAILYAEGGFVGGGETSGSVAEKHYVTMIRKLRRDKDLKAIVLRVNSGGGSVMTSENIWRELKLAKSKEEIPIVVSMGDVAASAAYMISVTADSIFAEKNTLTGSIGVFGMMPTFQELLNNTIGVNYDTVKTGKLAKRFSPYYTFSEKEREIMQAQVEETYVDFLQKVAEGRGKSAEEIHEIAQGRVWTGSKAVEIGLVDRLNDFEGAIQAAAHLANIEQYQLEEYPVSKNLYQQLVDELFNPEQARIRRQQAFLKEQLGQLYDYYELLQEVNSNKGPQARLPFVIDFE